MNNTDFDQRMKRNNAYYDAFAAQVKTRSEHRDFSKAFDCFLSKFPAGKTVLDIGCGAGNHLAVFKSKGISRIGIEPSEQMRKLASEFGETINGTFETLSKVHFENIGGIWAASSLLHVPQEQIFQVFQSIAQILPPEAPFYFTVRLGEGSKWDAWDDSKSEISRFLQLFNEDDLLTQLQDAGLSVSLKWVEESYWGRPSKWLSVIAQKS